MLSCLKEYLKELLRHYWTLGVGTVGGLIGLCLDIFTALTIPPWIWTTLFVVALLIAQFLVYYDVYSSVSVERHIQPGRRRALPAITKARKEGESLLEKVNYMKDYEIMTNRVLVSNWVKDTYAKIQKYDQSLAERFGDTDELDARPEYGFKVSAFLQQKLEILRAIYADIKRY